MTENEDRPAGHTHRGLPVGRIDAFSDGVFAIAATLLVLDIGLRGDPEQDMLGALLAAWPSYLAYVISFLTIGWVWIGHTAITAHIAHADGMFARLNLLLLLVVAFLPFPTSVMAEYVGHRDPERVAVLLYGATLLAISLLLGGLWRYAVSTRELLRDALSDEELGNLTAKTTQSIGLFSAVIVLGLVMPTVSVLLYLAISIYLVVPLRHLVRTVDVLLHKGR